MVQQNFRQWRASVSSKYYYYNGLLDQFAFLCFNGNDLKQQTLELDVQQPKKTATTTVNRCNRVIECVWTRNTSTRQEKKAMTWQVPKEVFWMLAYVVESPVVLTQTIHDFVIDLVHCAQQANMARIQLWKNNHLPRPSQKQTKKWSSPGLGPK